MPKQHPKDIAADIGNAAAQLPAVDNANEPMPVPVAPAGGALRRWAFAAVMRAGVAAGERRAEDIPRPIDHPSGHARGANSQRLLLVGSGPAVGWGVTSHEIALPGALARALSSLTGFGYTVDVIAESSMDATGAVRAMGSVAAHRYDAVIITVGINDALSLTPFAEWSLRMREMMESFEANFPPESPLFVVGIQPIHSILLFNARVTAVADAHAQELNRISLELTSRSARTVFIPLPAPSAQDADRYRTGHEYTRWGLQLARQMAPHIVGAAQDARKIGTPTPVDATKRHQAVDLFAAAALDRELAIGLNQITTLANRTFHTQTALLTVLGADSQWNLATSGPELGDLPRALSLCETTIQFGDVLVVPDTLADARFRDSELGADGPPIRFYAGFPIEAPTGERIGALCVMDTQPRLEHHDINEQLMRELAFMAQKELWRYLRDVQPS